MPDLTPNLKLKKPIWDKEPADIRVLNENMDTIDENFIKKFDKTGGTIDGNVVVTGEFVGNNNITAYSDEIVKENIIELTPEVLKKLSKIKFYNYTMINQPGKLRVGVMASELQELFPELVVEVDGIKTVDYTGLNTYFSYAIQQILVGGVNGK